MIFFALLLFAAGPAMPGPDTTQKKTKIDFLFSPKNIKALNLGELKNFDVTGSGAIILLTNNNLFDAGAKRFIVSKEDPCLRNLCCASDGTLFAVSGNTLECLSGGAFENLTILPSAGMQIADGGKGRIYLFGGETEPNRALYMIEEGKGYIKICEMPKKILALVASQDTVYFSVANDIYEIKFGGKFKLICRIPGPEISSLAIDNNTSVIYFTAGKALYGLSKDKITFVGENFGEILRFSNGALYVLKPSAGTLIRITGLNF